MQHTDYKNIDINDKKKVTKYGDATIVLNSLKSLYSAKNAEIIVAKGNSQIYDGQHYAFAILYEYNYPDTTKMHEIGRWGMLSCYVRDNFYSTQRYIQQKKAKKKALIKKLAIGAAGALVLLFGILKCNSGSSDNKTEKVKTTTTQTSKQNVEYVKGDLSYSWQNKFKLDGVTANWNYETKTVTFKAKEVRNVSEHPTGSLKIALFMLDKPYEGGSLTGKVAETVISTPELKPNYGWNDVEWKANFLSSAPASGEKYPVISILEYATSNDETNWFICGNNYLKYGKVNWQPK